MFVNKESYFSLVRIAAERFLRNANTAIFAQFGAALFMFIQQLFLAADVAYKVFSCHVFKYCGDCFAVDYVAANRKVYTTQIEEGRAWVAKPESEWVHHPCEPIVSEELWNSVNDMLIEKKLTGVRQSRTAKTLFGGLCHCQCGGKMYVPSNMKKYVCDVQGCRRKIPIDTLEAIFQSELDTFAFAPETLDENKRRLSDALQATTDLIEGHEQNITRLDSQIDSLLTLHQSGAIDQDGFAKRYKPLGDRNRELAAELPRLIEKRHKLSTNLNRQADVVAETQDVAQRYPELPFSERRRLVETVVERVTVSDDEVEFHYLFDPRR